MPEDEEKIRTLIERWAEAVHGGDMDGVLADHSRDIVMFDVPPPHEGVRGIDAYRETWPRFFEWQAGGALFEIVSLDVTAGDEVAYVHALLRCGTPQELAEQPANRLRLTIGLRKEQGRWVVAHEHHSFADRSTRTNAHDSQEEEPMTTDGLTTCLWFDGQAEEAANHYASIFKNSAIGRIGRYSEAGPGPAGSVLTVEFELNGQKFVGLNGGPQFTFNEAVSFQIFCKDQDEVDYYWSKLCEGGEEGVCGWLKDMYGVSWQVIPEGLIDMLGDEDPEKAKRTTEAMLAMTKLDIAALEKAYAGDYAAH